MNKTERQLAITLELQRNKMLRAEDLGAKFETSVRTIYRDIQALSEAGVPIYGAPGQGYSLMEGYFLPPITFTAEEAVTLLMGTDFILQRLDREYSSEVEGARPKIEAILPESVRDKSTRIRETMRVLHTGEPFTHQKVKNYLGQVRRAILERRKISITYVKKMADSNGNRKTIREVDPYGLTFVQGNWTLIGRCDIRKDIRHFRLSRMTELIVLESYFVMPPEFNLNDYRPRDDRNKRVLIKADLIIADKILEIGNFYMEATEEHEDSLLVYYRVRDPEELVPYILSWGGDVEVIEPQSLCDRIQEEAQKIMKRY
ncbi:helix-turn-helix transcriptional regulator [Paenibacillus sp. QZ-Y1]|uniref:helix-turn-helix transcriptional regulator n=1 Tax=Paenibacillus sp. QZ-Y1 TaxID=3414511 RepID=UPI003F7AC31C